MKKHLPVEKIGSKIELSLYSLLFFILFVSTEVNSQIPVNGFCKLKFYKMPSGYSRLLSMNFNGDSYSDLILFNPESNEISALSGAPNESFDREKIYSLPLNISNFALLREMTSEAKSYAFVSRKNTATGIIEFSKYGKPLIKNQIKFNSYPEKVAAADIDGDLEKEILVCGPAFEGLSILVPIGTDLKEIKLPASGSFSSAIFIDLSNDGFPDIAAYNLLQNSIIFFFNDGRGNFKETRSFLLDQKAANLYAFDMNLDSFQDLVFSQGNSIKIFYGDFSSSYSKQIELKTKNYPDEFIVGDFNRDGKIDIVYLNLQTSTISALFSKDEFYFYPEIILLKKERISSIIPFYSRFIDGLAAICDNGTLLTNTRIKAFLPKLDISLSVDAEDIAFLDANNDLINDICFIDVYENSIKFLIRNIEGVPATYYSIPLRAKHTNMLVNKLTNQSADIFCYSLNKKLIECITIDFNSGKFFRQEFYSLKPISDLTSTGTNPSQMIVLSLINKELHINFFEKKENWELLSEYYSLQDVSNFNWSTLNGIKLYYWTYTGDSVKLFQTSFPAADIKPKLVLKAAIKNVVKIFSVTDDFFNLDNLINIGFVVTDQKHYILISYDDIIGLFDHSIDNLSPINDKEQFFIGESRINGTKRLFINSYDAQTIYKLNILRKGEKVFFSILIDNVNAKKFFIKNMTAKNYHLVYLNRDFNCISIRQI